MLIRDIHTDILYPISQELGSGSKSCSLDPGALLNASHVLQKALHDAPDLVLINRFGGMGSLRAWFCQRPAEFTDGRYSRTDRGQPVVPRKMAGVYWPRRATVTAGQRDYFDWALSTRYQAAHA